MSHAAEKRYAALEYLAFERASEAKHEFLDGRIYAMSGASRQHVRIAVNLTVALGAQLRGRPCEPYGSDMRGKVEQSGLYTYPDLTISCAEPVFEDAELDTLTSPSVAFEILSPSTEPYDRRKKLALYQGAPTIRHIILMSQSEVFIEHYRRVEGGRWDTQVYLSLDAIVNLEDVECTLRVSDIYENVGLKPEVVAERLDVEILPPQGTNPG